MLPVSVRTSVLALIVFAVCPPLAAQAFGLNLGPLHFELPIPVPDGGHRITRTDPAPPDATDNGSPTLLYPVLAWPSLYDDIFWPKTATPRAFGIQAIFDQAFSNYASQRPADLCPYKVSVDEVVMRIGRETMPTPAQKPVLQKLGTALGQADGYLIKSCPPEIPAEPVSRLRLMDHQIDATIMALEITRPALADFVQSLDDKQRARLDGPAPQVDPNAAASCKLGGDAISAPLARLQQAVQPTEAQQPAFAALQDAFRRAADDFSSACGETPARTALSRLDAAEARLDATWRAVQTLEVALATFQKQLTDEQNAGLNTLDVVSAR